MTEKIPYYDRIGPNGVITRTFHHSTDPSHLKWHQDEKDRNIFIIESGGWLFQEDGRLPILMEEYNFIHIKKNVWHRVLKGHGNLVIRIYEK